MIRELFNQWLLKPYRHTVAVVADKRTSACLYGSLLGHDHHVKAVVDDLRFETNNANPKGYFFFLPQEDSVGRLMGINTRKVTVVVVLPVDERVKEDIMKVFFANLINQPDPRLIFVTERGLA